MERAVAMAKRFGGKVSDTIEEKVNADEPIIPDHLIIFFQAFKDLSRQRSVGFAPSCIPFLDIIQYARYYNFSDEMEEDLLYYVKGLDDHYLEILNKDAKKRQEQAKNSNVNR